MKVIDKRIFDADGKLRDDLDAPAGESKPVETASVGDPASSGAAARDAMPPAPDFPSFILGLYSSALMSMGVMATEGEDAVPDPVAARHAIDLMQLMKDKTAGNLTDEEETLLSELLADAQLKYAKACGG